MTAQLSFFPVGNGDMTLVQTEGGNRILIDMNIRSADDDPDDDTPDVAAKLRDKLVRDAAGRLYVDVLLLSHPDEDHCRGLRRHFHLGPPDEWSKSADKIVIREIWSSPMVFVGYGACSNVPARRKPVRAIPTAGSGSCLAPRRTPWRALNHRATRRAYRRFLLSRGRLDAEPVDGLHECLVEEYVDFLREARGFAPSTTTSHRTTV